MPSVISPDFVKLTASGIACVILLRIAPGKPEAELSRHHECVESVANILPNDPKLTVTNFDWHTNVKGLGDASAVESM